MHFDFFRRIVRAPKPSVRAQLRHVPTGLAGVAVALTVAAVLVGGLLLRWAVAPSASPPTTGSAGSSASQVALGSDGLPTQIDGQRVYRVNERAEWQNLTGSFLLGAYAAAYQPPCPPREPPLPSEDLDLVGGCTDPSFSEAALMSSTGNPYTLPLVGFTVIVPAPLGASALNGWLDQPLDPTSGSYGRAIVVRVHTHDPEAAHCSADQQAACEAAVVVEAVVWPYVPAQLGGERVYRAADQASFPTSGSFLLGGLVTWPYAGTPCPSAAGPPGDGQDLLPWCNSPSIDGLALSLKGSFDVPANEFVVVRVHIHDPAAAACRPSVVAECEAAVVIESVVWRSNP